MVWQGMSIPIGQDGKIHAFDTSVGMFAVLPYAIRTCSS